MMQVIVKACTGTQQTRMVFEDRENPSSPSLRDRLFAIWVINSGGRSTSEIDPILRLKL